MSIFSCTTTKLNGNDILSKDSTVKIENTTGINSKNQINELKLYLSSALYTKKYMYKRFGHWDEVIVDKTNNKNYLIWNNCKLFEDRNELFNVAASGIENRQEMYSSVIIFNSKQDDLFTDASPLRDTLVSLFYYGTQKTKLSKDRFYRDYWKMRKQLQK